MFAKAPQHEEDDNRDGLYMAVVKQAVRFPKTVLLLTVALLVGVRSPIRNTAPASNSSPVVEPDYGLLYVHARGNLSLAEMDAATRDGRKPACSAGPASSRSIPASARRRAAAPTFPKTSSA